MPDPRRHRGAHPQDAQLFGTAALPLLRAAAGDLAWLLERGYASASALKLVGDRHNLDARQRTAVLRATCSDQDREARLTKEVPAASLRGRTLLIDGYNVLTTVEAALAGGVLLRCRDGTFRDMASIHGTWRKVEETVPSIRFIGAALAELGVAACRWYLDSPVSNSGRLKTILRLVGAEIAQDWQIELVNNPDPLLSAATDIVASADSVILDRCAAWFNLARYVVEQRVANARVVDLS